MTILLWLVAALGVVCIVLAVLALVQMRANKRSAMELAVSRSQNDNLTTDLQATRATIKARDLELAGSYGEKTALLLECEKWRVECEKWQKLYNELLTTYQDAQGDAHATVPLQEVAPVKRTRKKAGA